MIEYTLHSRMRRAITWVYWEPKSKMTICSFMTNANKTKLFACEREIWRDKKRRLRCQISRTVQAAGDRGEAAQSLVNGHHANLPGIGIVNDLHAVGRVGDLADVLPPDEFLEVPGKPAFFDVEHLDRLVELGDVHGLDRLLLAGGDVLQIAHAAVHDFAGPAAAGDIFALADGLAGVVRRLVGIERLADGADVIGYRGRAGDRRIHGGICRGNGNGAVGWGFSQGAGRVMGRGRRVSDLLLAASCEEKSSHQPEAQRQLHGESLAPRREKSRASQADLIGAKR